jgi:hypothetical protein
MRKIVVFIWLAALAASLTAGIPPEERQALLDLYQATHGDGWIFAENWLGPPGTESTWLGVSCNSEDTHVIRLELAGNNLTGVLPASLHLLKELQRLEFSDNALEGSLPDTLGDLTRLQGLFLSRNQLEGRLPASLGNLRRLEQLHLDGNRFQGEIPESLGNLTRLYNAGGST